MSALFDFNNRVTLTGSLSTVKWTNPHIELIVDTKNGDQVVTWSLEGPSPGFFRTRNVGKAELADGRVVSLCPQNC